MKKQKKQRDATRSEQNIALKVLKWFGASIGTLFMIIIVTGVMFACIFAVYCKNYLADTALEVNVEELTLNEKSYIYYYDKDKNNWEVLDELYIENRTWVPYEDLPEYVFNSLVAIEDKRFWTHHGVDWYRTLGAAYNIFLGDGSTFGGSTITQQVIKNTTGHKEVTVRRKLSEIFSALQFDEQYGKETTLELYMNLVYFGQGCYGIESAAQTYFGKHASELSLAEAASIVGITNLPTYYDPYQNRDHNKERQETILYAMKEQGYISDSEYRAAKAEKLVFKRDVSKNSEAKRTGKVQSYFVDQVIEDVISDLMKERGVSRRIAQNYLYTGGYKIYITMDTDVQAIIDEVYTNPEYWPLMLDEDELEAPPQSAIVVLDPSSGSVLGMYGGLGEKTGDRVRNRASMMKKQPGSSIKPIAVYAPAIDAGLINPSTVYTDMPAMLESGNPYPKNYDRVYTGQMTILEAVKRSNNTIPVQLVRTMGPEHCFEFAKYKMGLSTLVEGEHRGEQYFTDQSIASMSLGGLTDGVTVEEMAAAYAVFPNGGIYNEPHTYTKVEDSNGRIVLQKGSQGVAVIKESTAYYMNYLLTNVIHGTNGTGINARLTNSIAAGKTGTTDDDYDRWFVGYTPYYSCAVWYGYDYNHTIKPVTGTSPAVPLWKAVMEQLHENLEPKEFFTPDNTEIVKISFCADSGLLATDACRADVRGSRVLTGTFISTDVPHDVCDLHRYVDICSESGQLANENCPVETRKQVAMLAIDRYFPDFSIALSDEQYTIRLPDLDYTEANDDGEYHTIPRANRDGTPPKNAFCTAHTATEVPVDPNDDPTVSEFPTESDSPPITTNSPGADTSASPSENEATTSPEFPTEPDTTSEP